MGQLSNDDKKSLWGFLFPFNFLLAFIPFSLVAELIHANALLIFSTSVLAIIPLALLLSRSTEDLSFHTNPTVASLFNATTGNLIELFIAFFAIRAGLLEVVKASITGSILVNILLLIGLSIFVGGFRYKRQLFNQQAAGVASSMLLVSVVGMAIPTIFGLTTGLEAQGLSRAISLALGFIYILSLVFTLFTHSHVFVVERLGHHEKRIWPIRTSLLVLAFATGAAAFESALVVQTIEPVSKSLGMTEGFIGLVIIAILTNIAEKVAAVTYALENHIDLALSIGMNSAIQIALFAAPVMVIMAGIVGQPLDLVFTPYELVAMVVSVLIINHICADGDCQWLEGAQLLTVYLIIVIAFYFIP